MLSMESSFWNFGSTDISFVHHSDKVTYELCVKI